MLLKGPKLKNPQLFPNSTCEHRMLHHHTHNCTISYFIFFSKQEMCRKAILRQFFFLLVIFQSFFQGLAAFSVDSEPKKNPEFFFKKYANDEKNIQIKNLITFPKQFPDHPLQLYVYYYIGCDEIMQNASKKGSEKYLLNALAAFDNVEKAWMRCTFEKTIPDTQAEEYAAVKDAALIQKAQIYILLAKQSQGIKRQTLLQEAKNSLNHNQDKKLFAKTQFLNLSVLLEEENMEEALHLLSLMEKEIPTSDHYLNCAKLTFAHHLYCHNKIEEAYAILLQIHEDVLTSAEALDLWIQQSLCLRDMGNYHAAHLAISKAVNSSVASSQRIRAMCLRATLYEIEGRDDLAIKQWEAIKTKNGRWGHLAKLKLNPSSLKN